jgi:hypothetical protein
MGMVAIGGATPALQAAAQSPEFLGQAPNSELYYQAIEYALPVASPIVFSTLDPAMGRALDSVLAGTDPAEALATANEEVTQAFADAAAG